MKKLLLALLVAAVASIPVAMQAASGSSASRMLVILSSADIETQAMALVLSNQVASAGTGVHLLLCGPAGDIALAKPPASAEKVVTPKGMTVLSLLEALEAKGAGIDVCAIYLPNRDLGRTALAEGVGVARPQAIAAEMTASDTRLAIF